MRAERPGPHGDVAVDDPFLEIAKAGPSPSPSHDRDHDHDHDHVNDLA
jgi:hypothetical protein